MPLNEILHNNAKMAHAHKNLLQKVSAAKQRNKENEENASEERWRKFENINTNNMPSFNALSIVLANKFRSRLF